MNDMTRKYWKTAGARVYTVDDDKVAEALDAYIADHIVSTHNRYLDTVQVNGGVRG